MKTTNEVLAETGLTYPMLLRLKDLGIVPKAKRLGLGNRKGVIGTFEDDVVELIAWVKERREEGLSLAEIAEKKRNQVADSERSVEKNGNSMPK